MVRRRKIDGGAQVYLQIRINCAVNEAFNEVRSKKN